MPMLRLSSEQAAALQAIKMRRDLVRLTLALADAFPTAASQRGVDDHATRVADGARRGAALGLDRADCVGRYLACGLVLGSAFETRPEHAWARSLLAATDRPQDARVFQLCRRTREELARRPVRAGGHGTADGDASPAAFDRALAALDAVLRPCGTLGSLLPAAPAAPGVACDLDAIDLRLAEPAASDVPRRYRLDDGARWRRLPADRPRAALKVTAGEPSPAAPQPTATALPPRLHVVAHAADQGHARLRVRTRCAHGCDPQVHPRITFNGPQGLASWHGAHAADVLLDLPADAPPGEPATPGLQPPIGRETSARWAVLSFAACGLRDAGPALGEQQARVAIHPGEQHWMAWRREPAALIEWRAAGALPVHPRAAAPPCRIERDGLPLDASRWRDGLHDLDRQLREGLSRLAAAWRRARGVSDARLRCEPAVMSGDAALTWGWTEGGDTLADPPCHRLAGAIDLVVCRLGLRLAGTLSLPGAACRIALRCEERADLRTRFDRRPADTDLPALMRTARVAFRHPFTVALEALAPAGDVAATVTGALVGAGGLRMRPDGAGWQWFCELAIEPVSIAPRPDDPPPGAPAAALALLPALTLLDWSLG